MPMESRKCQRPHGDRKDASCRSGTYATAHPLPLRQKHQKKTWMFRTMFVPPPNELQFPPKKPRCSVPSRPECKEPHGRGGRGGRGGFAYSIEAVAENVPCSVGSNGDRGIRAQHGCTGRTAVPKQGHVAQCGGRWHVGNRRCHGHRVDLDPACMHG